MVTSKLHLLGPPSLVTIGRPARLHSVKTLALLAYLTLEASTSHSREKLAGLLWGESSDTRARQSLRQALYSLRHALSGLSEDCLRLAEGAIIFQPHRHFKVDAVEFLNLATAESRDLDVLRRAAHLYKGLLLEGVELSDCPAFEEWLFFQRDALEQQALAVLQTLVDGLIHQGSHQEALVFAQRLVRLDPLHEGAHRRLMQIHAALGDKDGVRRQYYLCTDVLAREMGVEPAAETQTLYRQLTFVKANFTVPPQQASAPQAIDQPLELPFLGREQELAALQARLDRAIAGQGGMVLVAGEAGLGKTQLVVEFMRRSQDTTVERTLPVRWLSGRCYEPEARAPYAVWGDALYPLTTDNWQPLLTGLPEVWRQQLARLVPELAPQAGNIEGVTAAESRLRLLQGVVQCLVHLTRSGCLLIFFDDLHWADEASLELIHYIVRHLAEYPLLIVGAYRPEAAADHPYLDHLLGGTDDVPAPLVLRLTPLQQKTVNLLLSHLGGELSFGLPDRLYHHSEGNPFVLLETLRTLIMSGRLRRASDGRLVEAVKGDLPMPRRVQELFRTRVATLSEEQRRVLNAAAVIGRPFSLRMLRQVSGQPEPQLLDLLQQLLIRTFLREKDDVLSQRSLDFYHDYFRRVIYEQLGLTQRQALHRRTAEALLARHRVRPQVVVEEVAHHYEQAGDAQAVTYLIRAAQQAEELFVYAHATDLYNRALTFHRAYLANELADCFDLLLAREAVLDQQGRRAEQADDVTALVELAETLGDAGRLAIACVRQAGFLTYTGQYHEARQTGERALGLYREAGDKVGEAQTLRELGFLHWSAGDYGTALAYGREALQLHRQLGDIDGEATALHNLAEIYRGLGSPRQALAQYERALNLYWAQQDQRRQGLTFYGLAHTVRHLGESNQALGCYQQALAHCQAAHDRLMTSRVHHTLASLQWETGAPDQALDHIHQALAISREIGYGPGIAHGLIVLSCLHVQRGEIDIAREHFQEAMTWLRLTEDQAGLVEIQAQLRALEQGVPETLDPPTTMGWVKSHVVLAEGKVYCEFESPMARQQP